MMEFTSLSPTQSWESQGALAEPHPRGPMDKKPTDITMLHALIACGKVLGKELKAFQNMWDDLHTGRQVQLSKPQRAWVEKKYTDLDLHGKPLPPPPAVKVRPKAAAFPWENDPKPLKPPGRS